MYLAGHIKDGTLATCSTSYMSQPPLFSISKVNHDLWRQIIFLKKKKKKKSELALMEKADEGKFLGNFSKWTIHNFFTP